MIPTEFSALFSLCSKPPSENLPSSGKENRRYFQHFQQVAAKAGDTVFA